jgi:hypothetical protein
MFLALLCIASFAQGGHVSTAGVFAGVPHRDPWGTARIAHFLMSDDAYTEVSAFDGACIRFEIQKATQYTSPGPATILEFKNVQPIPPPTLALTINTEPEHPSAGQPFILNIEVLNANAENSFDKRQSVRVRLSGESRLGAFARDWWTGWSHETHSSTVGIYYASAAFTLSQHQGKMFSERRNSADVAVYKESIDQGLPQGRYEISASTWAPIIGEEYKGVAIFGWLSIDVEE